MLVHSGITKLQGSYGLKIAVNFLLLLPLLCGVWVLFPWIWLAWVTCMTNRVWWKWRKFWDFQDYIIRSLAASTQTSWNNWSGVNQPLYKKSDYPDTTLLLGSWSWERAYGERYFTSPALHEWRNLQMTLDSAVIWQSLNEGPHVRTTQLSLSTPRNIIDND